jgi:hypothetical protein
MRFHFREPGANGKQTAHSLAVSRNILTMKPGSAFVRAQPTRSTRNTTFKARGSIEKLLHLFFRRTFIVFASASTFH